MSLEMYSDDGLTTPVLREEKITTLGTSHVLEFLQAADVQGVYKYSAGVYTLLTLNTQYTITGSALTTTAAIVNGEHLVVMPSDNLNFVFTGPEGGLRTLTKKLVLHKTGAFIYDALKLYSENFTITPIELVDNFPSLAGWTVGDINGYGLFDINNVELNNLNAVGLVLEELSGVTLGDLRGCAAVLNGIYVGDIIGNDDFIVALPFGVSLPTPNYASDKLEIFSTGDLRFALGVNGSSAIPGDTAFKRMVCVPTLTTAAPTQTVWIRETVTIPAVASDLPNMPFKLTGQEYPE